MCGRYVRKDGTPVFSFFEIDDRRVEWRPSYNVAPATQIPVVRREADGKREIVELTWGLVPSWAKPDAKLPLMINSRGETVASKPAYRSAFKARRCIVPASGYFEWQKLPEGGKQPFYFERTDGKLSCAHSTHHQNVPLTNNQHLAKLPQQKQGLMRDLLTGRVRLKTAEVA